MVDTGTKYLFFRILLLISGILVAGFAVVMFFQTFPYFSFIHAFGFMGTKTDAVLSKWDFNLFFYSHITASFIVLVTGPAQFLPVILRRYPRFHRVSGYLYIAGILLVAAPSGAGLSLYANGGLPAKTGFFLQSVVWFLITLKAWIEIRKRKWESHIIWMIRSYALTLAAMSLRTESYLMKFFFHTRPHETYLTVVWTSWVGNLLIAEMLIVSGLSGFLLHLLKK